jgi:hypothetical protein
MPMDGNLKPSNANSSRILTAHKLIDNDHEPPMEM